MKSSTLFAFLASFVAGSSLARPIDIGTRQSCASGVHVIVARASTEAPGQGIIGAVADEIVERIPGSDSVAVVYPATLTNYLSSESQGVAAMTKLIENYVADCPDSKIVLMGYSQGAHVTGDVLCGSSTSNPLPSNLGQNGKHLSLSVPEAYPTFLQLLPSSRWVTQAMSSGFLSMSGLALAME